MYFNDNEEFFWYVNFGITKTNAKKDPEKALEACIDSAYKDSCRNINYKRSLSELEAMLKKDSPGSEKQIAENYKALKEVFLQKCISVIRNCINDLLISYNIDFDSWHKELCTGEGAYDIRLNDVPPGLFENDNIGLTIGQCQKWVNMTLKNMLIMGMWDDSLLKYEREIHIPIDDKIQLEAKKAGIETVLPAWNNINNYDDYLNFQKELRSKLHIPPIKWEWDAWMR